jgi:superfamily II DNA or RNA helicase
MGLRAYQMKARMDIHKGFEDFDRQLGVLPTGCHAPGHPILMADGSVRAVESIQTGDKIMGPDSEPRTVLSLHTGTDEMFRVTPTKGEPFIVNAGHIFSLARTRTGKTSEDKQPWIREISVREWIDSTKTFRHLHKLRRVPIEFPDRGSAMRRIDPYILGVLLGDGSLHKGNISVCTPDPEVVEELKLYAQRVGSKLRIEPIPDNKATNYFFKGREMGYANEYVRESLRAMILAVPCAGKNVPEFYKTATTEIRAAVLAGLLDTDGHLSHAGYEFSSKSPRLATDVVFIARSLGLAAYQSVKVVNGEEYRRVSISGDCSWLPLRIARKRAPERNQIKNVLVTGFRVESIGDGTYHGFSLDGDHLYLDATFTVHHNSGKTILFSRLAQDYQPRRTLILAHREELITQAVDKLRVSTGIEAQVEMGDERASLDAPVVVASVQTLMREKRRERWPRDHFGLVVVDESHHILSNSYLNTVRHFDGHAKVLGVTATPDRGDKKNLGKYFENIACEVTLLDLINQGWLAPIKVKTVPLGMDLRGVRTSHGDFSADDLGHVLEPYLEQIADVLVEHRHRKTLVFLPLIAVSKRFAEICRERGLLAEHIDGQTNERKATLERFKRDETRILCNAMLLTEGYDEPSIDCIVCLRPTKVRALYSQIIGRGTRIWPGKDHLLVLDFLWQAEEHSLMRPANLIAEDEADAKALTEKIGADGDLEEAREEVNADRTRSLTDRLRANQTRRGSVLDPIELAVSLNEAALADYVPTMAWQAGAPTSKQLDVLAKFGLDTISIQSKGHASLILDRLITRRKLGLATPKQVRVMRRHGHQRPEIATFEEAKAFLDTKFSNR